MTITINGMTFSTDDMTPIALVCLANMLAELSDAAIDDDTSRDYEARWQTVTDLLVHDHGFDDEWLACEVRCPTG